MPQINLHRREAPCQHWDKCLSILQLSFVRTVLKLNLWKLVEDTVSISDWKLYKSSCTDTRKFWFWCSYLGGAPCGFNFSDLLFVGAPVKFLRLIRAVTVDYSKQFNNTVQPVSTVGGNPDNVSTPAPYLFPSTCQSDYIMPINQVNLMALCRKLRCQNVHEHWSRRVARTACPNSNYSKLFG